MSSKELDLKRDNSIQIALLEIVKRTDIDPERLEKFLDLQFKMEERQAESAFNESLKGFQKDCPIITHTKDLKHGAQKISTYAPFDEIKHVIQPHLDKWGLAYSFSTKYFKDELFELITTIKHVKGHKEESSYYYNPLMEQKGMNESQRRKSALSYAKRAGLEDALGIATAGVDDDAKRSIDTPITEESLNKIKLLMEKTGTEDSKMLDFLKVDSFEDLSEFEARKALHALKQKRSK